MDGTAMTAISWSQRDAMGLYAARSTPFLVHLCLYVLVTIALILMTVALLLSIGIRLPVYFLINSLWLKVRTRPPSPNPSSLPCIPLIESEQTGRKRSGTYLPRYFPRAVDDQRGMYK